MAAPWLTIKFFLSRFRTVAGLLSPRRMRSIPSGTSGLSGLTAGTNLTGRSLKELFVYKVCRPSIRPASYFARRGHPRRPGRSLPSAISWLSGSRRRMTFLRRGKAFPRIWMTNQKRSSQTLMEMLTDKPGPQKLTTYAILSLACHERCSQVEMRARGPQKPSGLC